MNAVASSASFSEPRGKSDLFALPARAAEHLLERGGERRVVARRFARAQQLFVRRFVLGVFCQDALQHRDGFARAREARMQHARVFEQQLVQLARETPGALFTQ